MRIATFNINNINKRLPNLLAWLDDTRPDIVALQELKAKDADFPVEAVEAAGYKAVWQGQKSWNGVALLARGSEPVVTRRSLPGDDDDDQARYIEAAIAGIVVASIYAPNGNPQPGPKFDYKLAWMKRLIAHAAELKAAGVPVVLAGDFNVAPTEIDIYPTRSWDDDALVQPAPRRSFRRLVDQGWTDVVRQVFPDQRIYSFWTYWRGRFSRDHGLLLDHILLSPDLGEGLAGAGVDRDVRGKEGASDHAPVWALIER
ncbi:exodeoxyribonuclease III [Bosea sp. CS1GBMeth4]|uniref:exodeoxyribonuclease III n=1 Tax=Bosea sp. CS1GBMeth4 TaxID=1892849 RepID=UPI0016487FD5|nr:exodeoxyribonuclease III [Bosea sp. CS1GBMeth4]